MTKARFTEEFKEEAIKQVLERGYTVPDVAKRLGVSAQSLYKWIKVCAPERGKSIGNTLGINGLPAGSTHAQIHFYYGSLPCSQGLNNRI